MRHLDGTRVRIDYIAIPKSSFPADCIGIEIKCRYQKFQEVTAALKQAIDYRHSAIIDRRSTAHLGHTPKFVLVYPYPNYDDGAPVGRWMAGAVRMAGRYNVGYLNLYRNWSGQPVIEAQVSGQTIWHSLYGVLSNAEKWRADHGRGCA